MRADSVPGEPRRYLGVHRPALRGQHRYRMPAGVRTAMGMAAASAVTIMVVGSYFAVPLLRPSGQLQPPRLPGIERQVPGIEESAAERIQQADDPPAASRSQPRQSPAPPVLPREPDPAAAADRSSSPPAAATPTPAGDTRAQGPMPTTPCPPPLPPPRPGKSKPPKDKPAKVLTVFPTASPSTSPEGAP